MSDETENTQHSQTQTDKGHAAGNPSNGHEEEDTPWHKKYLEKIIGGVITAFLIGGAVWLISHFAIKIENIEKTIAAHHGPQWEKIEKVIAVGNLRAEFLEAERKYEKKLSDLSTELKLKNQEIQNEQAKYKALLKALSEWTKRADKLVFTSYGKKYDALAHLSEKVPKDKDVATLNVAHASGTRFNVGDKIVVTNTGSGQSETTTVEISSAYTDIDHSDVLIQLGEQPANILGLSKTLGKIKISVKKKDLEKDDPNRWKSLSELLNEIQP